MVALKVLVSSFNNDELALDQMEVAYSLLRCDVPHPEHERMIGSTRPFAKDHREHPNRHVCPLLCLYFLSHISYRAARHHYYQPRLRSHRRSIIPILRSLYKIYRLGHPFRRTSRYVVPWAEQERITHGTFHVACQEGLLSNTSVHAGIRCKMTVRPDIAVPFQVCCTHAFPCRARLI